MSLDVSLYSKEKKTVMCYSCMHEHEEQEILYDANITHNLGEMAAKAGVYKALWRPEEIGAKYAKDIIEIVEKGLDDLRARPEYFEQFNSPNGWGMYEHFVPFVSDYLNALKENPDAEIHVSR
jgi:hypothetical protein